MLEGEDAGTDANPDLDLGLLIARTVREYAVWFPALESVVVCYSSHRTPAHYSESQAESCVWSENRYSQGHWKGHASGRKQREYAIDNI